MMSNKGDSEKRIVCPYNAAHSIIPHRLQTHLVKCRKNYPDTKIVTCMHNSTHRVPEPELAFHHDNCSDRLGLDKFIFAPITNDNDKFHVPNIDLQPTETWEDEDRASYNPEEHCLSNPVLRKKDTLSKAKRRNFRWEERQRMQTFHSNSGIKEPVENQSSSSLDSHPRKPHTFSKGVQNKDLLEDDVDDMLKKIHLGANTAVVPPRKPQNLCRHHENERSEHVYPSNIPQYQLDQNDFPSILHSSGIQMGNGVKPKVISRGRGSVFGTK